jgi:hypothetical protein
MKLLGYAIALAAIVWVLMNYSGRQDEVDGVIPQAYEQSIDRANNVEQMLQDSLEQRANEIEQSEN